MVEAGLAAKARLVRRIFGNRHWRFFSRDERDHTNVGYVTHCTYWSFGKNGNSFEFPFLDILWSSLAFTNKPCLSCLVARAEWHRLRPRSIKSDTTNVFKMLSQIIMIHISWVVILHIGCAKWTASCLNLVSKLSRCWPKTAGEASDMGKMQ